MFPGIFEWMWDPGHILFMGIFWIVLLVLLSGIVLVVARSLTAANRESLASDDPPAGNGSLK